MFKYYDRATAGVSRWCDCCKTVKPSAGGRLIPSPDGIHGRWYCKTCFEKL